MPGLQLLNLQLQATQLSKVLERLGKLDGALWVSSPLTRAIETLLISCPPARNTRGGAFGQGQQLKVCTPSLVVQGL